MSMNGICIAVTGNIARVTRHPGKITSGTVGLPVEFSFDKQWEGLRKIAVFQAGFTIRAVDEPDTGTVVPWEVLTDPGAWLYIGVYGISTDGTVVIPTIWVSVGAIEQGVKPDGDPSTEPTLPIWQKMANDFYALQEKTMAKQSTVFLSAADWVYDDGFYFQFANPEGVTRFSQVDLKPSPQQLVKFHNLHIALTTVNEDGILTVYAIGNKPAEDYTLEISITEVNV